MLSTAALQQRSRVQQSAGNPSALYELAAPSTPKWVRVEIEQRIAGLCQRMSVPMSVEVVTALQALSARTALSAVKI
jgi:hypothetical protein